MTKPESHIGEKYNRLTIIGIRCKRYTRTKYICECECGNIIETYLKCLQTTTKSCGCYKHESEYQRTHGMTGTRFYVIYRGIVERCTTQNIGSDAYNKYSSKGIKCLWNSFEEFKEDMYESYLKHVQEFGEEDTTIDRIDPHNHYCKSNCRWATRLVQMNNKTNNLYITIGGVTKTAAEWVREYNTVKYGTFYYRVVKKGWEPLKALTTPLLHRPKEK